MGLRLRSFPFTCINVDINVDINVGTWYQRWYQLNVGTDSTLVPTQRWYRLKVGGFPTTYTNDVGTNIGNWSTWAAGMR